VSVARFTGGLTALVAGGLLAACATSEDIAVVSQQLQTTQQRNAELETRVQEIKGQDLSVVQGQLETMRRDLDALQSGLDDEKAQMFALRKELTERFTHVDQRMDEAAARGAALEQSLAQMPETLRTVVATLTSQMDQQAQVVARLEAAMRPAKSAAKSTAKAQPLPSNESEKPVVVPAPPALDEMPEATPDVKGTDVEAKVAYNQAQQQYKDKQYEGATTSFQQFLARYPDSSLVPNAQFWLAECYVRTRDYARSLEAYEQVVTAYPIHEKATRALYRKAMAFLEMQDKEAARTTLRRLIADYPTSEDAQQARTKLGALK